MNAPKRRSERGMSLVEILVVLIVVSGLMIITYSMMEDAVHATMFNESHNDLIVVSQRTVNELHNDLFQSRVAYEEDAVGAGYRSALNLPAANKPWNDSLLPVFESEQLLDPDTGNGADRRTGNSLLLVRPMAPLSIMYDDDDKAGTPDVELLVDRYQFVYTYLSASSKRNFSDTKMYLDLMRATSKPFADYFQLSNLSSAQLKKVIPKVTAAKLDRAWNSGQPVATAFYTLSGALDGAFDAPINTPTIDIEKTASLMPEFRGGRVGGKMEYSVAFEPNSPKKPFVLPIPLTYYAQRDSKVPKFPSGFEVKIAGPSGKRKAVARVLLMSNYRVRTYEAQQGFVSTSVRF